jgi:NADPH-dependent curcumin reductase CurA
MADHSKIILCGATATYNAWGKFSGVTNMEKIISKRILMQGILYFAESAKTMNEAFMEIIELNVKGIEVIVKGMEALPTVYRDMIEGKFIGKPVVEFVSSE